MFKTISSWLAFYFTNIPAQKPFKVTIQVGRYPIIIDTIIEDNPDLFDDIPQKSFATAEIEACIEVFDNETFDISGGEFRFARKVLGNGVLDLAKYLKVDPVKILRWEKDYDNIPKDIRDNMVELLKISLEL